MTKNSLIHSFIQLHQWMYMTHKYFCILDSEDITRTWPDTFVAGKPNLIICPQGNVLHIVELFKIKLNETCPQLFVYVHYCLIETNLLYI